MNRADARFPSSLFDCELRAEHAWLTRPNILVAGRSGSGRRSLLAALFGDTVEWRALGTTLRPTAAGAPAPLVTAYETAPVPDAGEVPNERYVRTAARVIAAHRSGRGPEDLHVAWYVVDASRGDVDDLERRLAREVLVGLPVLFVLCKSDAASDDARRATRRALKTTVIPNSIGVVEVGIPPASAGPSAIRFGLAEVVSKTLAMVPDPVRLALVAAQQIEPAMRRHEASVAVRRYAFGTCAVGWQPIARSEAQVLAPLLTTLIARLAVIYGHVPLAVSPEAGAPPSPLGELVSTALTAALREIAQGALVGPTATLDAAAALRTTTAIGDAFEALFDSISAGVLPTGAAASALVIAAMLRART